MEHLFSTNIANLRPGKLQKYFKSYIESAYQFDQDREIHKAALLEKNGISSATEHFFKIYVSGKSKIISFKRFFACGKVENKSLFCNWLIHSFSCFLVYFKIKQVTSQATQMIG